MYRFSHQELLFQDSSIPFSGGHSFNIHGGVEVVVADYFKELLVIVWWQPRIRKRKFSKNMVPEENLMEKAVREGGVHCSLKEGSDQQGKSSQLDIKQSKATIFRAPVEDQLVWLLQAVLVQPGLHLAGDGCEFPLPVILKRILLLLIGRDDIRFSSSGETSFTLCSD